MYTYTYGVTPSVTYKDDKQSIIFNFHKNGNELWIFNSNSNMKEDSVSAASNHFMSVSCAKFFTSKISSLSNHD